MATVPINPEANTTFQLRIAKHASICAVNRPSHTKTGGIGRIKKGIDDECTLSVDKDDEAQQYSGRCNSLKTSFVLMPTEIENVLDLVPLETEYDFGEWQSPPQANGHAGLPSPNDDEPDPENPYDYRHYLHEIEDKCHLSPYPSTASTPLLEPTPRASSPLTIISDTDSLPNMPATLKQRKAAAAESRKLTQSQSRKRSVRPRSPLPGQESSPAPASSRPDADDSGLIIEDYLKPAAKRQRMTTSSTGPMSLARASSTPRAPSPEATPVLHTASSGDDEEDEDDEDDDVEDFRLPDPAAEIPISLDRKDSVFDPVAVSNLLAAFGEEDEGEDSARPEAQGEASKAESSESESESEEE